LASAPRITVMWSAAVLLPAKPGSSKIASASLLQSVFQFVILPRRPHAADLCFVVGDTGIEPMTSSVSGKIN